MNINIFRAQVESIESINSLIRNSKSFWDYPKSYLERAIPLLMVDESYLNTNCSFEIRIDDELVGFIAFAKKGNERHLDHLWIAPSRIKTGIGHQALLFTESLAQELGWSELFTYPDPPAEMFYLKNGFIDTGRRIPSRIEGGPEFAVFIKKY